MERLLALVEPEPMTGCWLWVGVKTPRGYGVYKGIDRSNRKAHRMLWEACRGPIPDRRQLHHRCEQRACVNPGHLEVVTAGDHRAKHVKRLCKWGHPKVIRPSGRRVCPTCIKGWKRGGKTPRERRRLQLRYGERVERQVCTVCEQAVVPGAKMCRLHLAAARDRQRTRTGDRPWSAGGRGRPPVESKQA